MFSRRFLTAALLIGLLCYLLFSGKPMLLGISFTVFLCLAASEWLSLMPSGYSSAKWCFCLVIALIPMLGLHAEYLNSQDDAVRYLFIALCLGLCVLPAAMIIAYPRGACYWDNTWVLSCFGAVLFLLASISLIQIYQSQTYALSKLFYLFFLVWSADSSAYFWGKYCGRRALIPHVSPGKTYEGFYAALISPVIVSALFFFYSDIPYSFWRLQCLGFLTALIAIEGDLLISALKRQRDLKDTGSILPGHGGVLDRIDSLLLATPCFFCMINWIERWELV